MTDENILDIPSNSMLESMMSEYRNEEQSNLNNNNNDSPTNKETQIKSTINTLSINVNKTLNNETKPINNLIELPPIEDKQFIDWRSEENNSNINVGKKIHIDKSLGYFTQVKEYNHKVPLNILHPLTFQSNTILKNISPIQHTEMNNDKVNEELIINCNDSNNMETLLPTSSSSLFLPTTSPITDSQSLSLSSSIEENDYNFECIVALNSISTSLESINNNNNDEQEKSIDDDDDKEDNYFNFNVKKSPNIIDLSSTNQLPKESNIINRNQEEKLIDSENNLNLLSPTQIYPPPSYKETCRFIYPNKLSNKRDEEWIITGKSSPSTSNNKFEKLIKNSSLQRRSSLLRQNSIRYKKGSNPRSPLFLSKTSRSLSREGISTYLKEEEHLLEDCDNLGSNKSLKSSKSVNPLDEKSLLEESFISKSIDNTRSISLSNNNSMESNLLSQLQEENLIIDDCKNLSLDEDDTSILNRGILKDSKDDSFDLNEQNEVSSPSMLFGPSFSLSRISENTESLDEPIDSAPRFHTVKEKSSGRRSSLSIFGITTHRRGKSEDNTCSLLKDDNDILINCGNDDGEVFLSSNNPLESVENVSIRERSKNNRDPIVSSRDNKCKSQFLLPDSIGIQNLSKSNNNLSDFNETNELNVAKILETSYDDQDIPQSYPSTSAPTSSKNSKKEKNNIKKNNDNQISFLENRLTKKYESLKDFNLTDKEKELEENSIKLKLKKQSTKTTKFRLTSTIAKGKGNDKGSKSILGSLFGGKKKTPKPSIQGIFPNPNGLGSKAISEAAFASINQNCNVIVGDSTKKSSTLPTDIKKVESQVSFTTTTDPIMGKFYERDRYL